MNKDFELDFPDEDLFEEFEESTEESTSEESLVQTNLFGEKQEVKGTFKSTDKLVAKTKITEDLHYWIRSITKMDTHNLAEAYDNNIKALKLVTKINNEKRAATKNEQKELLKYSGFGALKGLIKENDLKQYLTSEEIEELMKSAVTAYYTPFEVVKFMHAMLDRFGFEGGRVLDPSVGTGRYMGATTKNILENSEWVGIDIDRTATDIAKHLYQDATIHNESIETVYLKDDSFDVVISNIPFGNYSLHDEMDKELNDYNFSIHDYYFAKAIKKVRVGGIIAFLTTHWVMDKTDSKLRHLVNKHCDFLGALRLPSSVFGKDNVNIVTDIIFLQKQNYPESKMPCDTLELGSGVKINKYFLDNPNMVIGNLAITSSATGPILAVKFSGDFKKELVSKQKYFKGSIYTECDNDLYKYDDETLIQVKEIDAKNLKEGSYCIYNGGIYVKQGHFIIPIRTKQEDMVKKLIEIKQVLYDLNKAQLDNLSDEVFLPLQQQLNSLYDSFIAKYGYITSKPVKKEFGDDPDYYLMTTLEVKEENGFRKFDIFFERTIGEGSLKANIETLEDAIIYSINTLGKLNIDLIATVLNRTIQDIREDLVGKKIAFLNPATDEFELSSIYLSGDVRKKYKEALSAEELDPRFKRNVDALKAVLPKYEADVYFALGCSWIPKEIYEEFIAKTLKIDKCYGFRIHYYEYKSEYKFVFNERHYSKTAVAYNLNFSEYGSTDMGALEILESSLNQKRVQVKVKNFETEKYEVSAEKTAVVQEKQMKLENLFIEWINNDDDKKMWLLDIYNDRFNSSVEPKVTDDLLRPQISKKIQLRPHQSASALKFLLGENNLLLAHSVGLGKTYVSQIAGFESKKLGLANKVLYCIPGSLVESGQFASDFMRLYPYANVLCATSKDFSKANRRKLISKMVTGNWDAIIIAHNHLGLIPLSKETMSKLMQEDIDEFRRYIEEVKQTERGKAVNDLFKMLLAKQTKLKDLLSGHKDEGLLTFEQLGVDMIVIDEAHNFKNLEFDTKHSNVAGIKSREAMRSSDLYYKLRYLRDHLKRQKFCMFLTGTPISNSISECYIMMKYLIPDILRKYEVYHFDQWCSVFGEIVARLEPDVTGNSFRVKERFSKFNNAPELIALFKRCADVLTNDMVDLKIPKLRGGKIINVEIERPESLDDYITELLDRIEMIQSGQVDPSEDNMLNVTTDGRKAAVDPRVVDINVQSCEEDTPKIYHLVKNVYKEYVAGNLDKLTQLIFCDLGTPGGEGYNVYEEIRKLLVEKGIPKEEIKFIHEGGKDEKRKALIDDFRIGKVRVLIGSTAKMGEGMNAQTRMVAIHHMDCAWKPAHIEQRDGRILRQGNMNSEVAIYRYVIKGTFDAYMWSLCEMKANYIAQIMNNKTGARTLEELSDVILSYAETKACCMNNPLLKRKIEIDNEITRLEAVKKGYNNQASGRIKKLSDLKSSIELGHTKFRKYCKDYEILKANPKPEVFSIVIEDTILEDRKEAGETIMSLIKKYNGVVELDQIRNIGSYRGFGLELRKQRNTFIGGTHLVLSVAGQGYKYIIDETSSAVGIIMKIEKRVEKIKTLLLDIKSEVAYDMETYKKLKATIDTKFEYEDKLQELYKEQIEVNVQLQYNKGGIVKDKEIDADEDDFEENNDEVAIG